MARFKPHASGRRTQYDEDREAVDPLGPIAADHGVAILLVHHLRETESDDPLDMIHGSAGLTGGVDGALVLKRKRGQADAYLHVDGRDIENPTELALEDADEPLGPKEAAELTDLPENTVRQRLYQMSKDGEVKVVARGRYVAHNVHNNRNNEEMKVTEVMDVMDSRNEDGVAHSELPWPYHETGCPCEDCASRWPRAEGSAR
jgi:hypothetical protein